MNTESTASEGEQFSIKQLQNRYRDAVVAIKTIDADGDQHVGSAFHIGAGRFVTARHVVDGQASWHVEPSGAHQNFTATALFHPKADVDVAVFVIDALGDLPAIPLGGHLEDWIDDQFDLNDVLVMGFPPLPLCYHNVLISTRGEVSGIIEPAFSRYYHFVVSAMARGGFSGGVVISEWNFALGVITASLIRNGQPEELGYMTVLSVEPIWECLGAHDLITGEDRELWSDLFDAAAKDN